jgi:hypothetical protein
MWRGRSSRSSKHFRIRLNVSEVIRAQQLKKEQARRERPVLAVDGTRLSIVPVGGGIAVAVPFGQRRRRTSRAQWVSEAIRLGIFYPDVESHPSYKRGEAAGRHTRYSLSPPPPELTALGLLMYQAIVQGVTWEAFKAVAVRARNSLWPSKRRKRQAQASKRSGVVFGLEWTVSRPSEPSMKRLFIGLKAYSESYDSHRRKVRRAIQGVYASLDQKGPPRRSKRRRAGE